MARENQLNNVTYTSDFDCDTLVDTIHSSLHHNLVHSILFDLIPGTISSFFAYQMYLGIEISHPIYSILFTNIVVSIFLSFLTFLYGIMNYFLVSCATWWFLNIWAITNMNVINIITWATIAFLRYYLLVYVKKEKKCDVVDMPKVRVIALIFNWTTVIMLSITRAVLFYPAVRNIIPFAVSYLIFAFILVAFLVSTFYIYYKMNIAIEQRLRLERLQRRQDEFGNTSSGQNERWSTVRHMANKTQAGNSNKSPFDPSKNANEPLANKKPYVSTAKYVNKLKTYNDDVVKTPRIQDDKYGGIYIGNIRPYGHTPKISSLTPTNSVYTVSSDGDGNNRWKKVDLNQKIIKTEEAFCRGNDNKLPNQVFGQENTNTLTSDYKNIDNIGIVNSSNKCIAHAVDVSSAQAQIHSLEDKSKRLESSCDSSNDDAYKDSKEHKSIVKAVVTNTICVAFIVLIAIVKQIIGTLNHDNVYIYLAASAFLKLYRSFATMISAIYCFEMMNVLFFQSLHYTRDIIQGMYTRMISCS